jgi:hypothetical protein
VDKNDKLSVVDRSYSTLREIFVKRRQEMEYSSILPGQYKNGIITSAILVMYCNNKINKKYS